MEFSLSDAIYIIVFVYGGYCGIRYWRGKDPWIKKKKGTQKPDAFGKFLVIMMFFFGGLAILFTIIDATK